MCIHVALLVVLALIPVITAQSTKLTLTLDMTGNDGELGEDQSFELPSDDLASKLDLSEAFMVENITVDNLMMPQPLPELTLTDLAGDTRPAISMGLAGRSGSLKSALLAKFGGSAQTEEAVAKGLAWLAKVQSRDGSWSLKGPFADGGNDHNRVSATAMALLAFAGAGQTHQSGEYKDNVQRGLYKLLQMQNRKGGFDSEDARESGTAYAQAQATIAICELYGMTNDVSLRKPAQEAVRFSQDWQDRRQGGWRYTPRSDSDLSVTGWYVMALVSAKMAKIETDSEVLKRCDRYLDAVSSENGSKYAYTDYYEPSLPMIAEGLLCRMYLGWSPTDQRIRRGANTLIASPLSIDLNDRDYYYWYYATQTLHHIGNPVWEVWNDKMRIELPKLQVASGKDTGSWPPQGDPHGNQGGRMYSTCLAIYCLEVYYRHLPLYDSQAFRAEGNL